MCVKKRLVDYRLKQQIKRLSGEERQTILEKSPLAAGAFQGESFHVFLKSEPDFEKACVTSPGEIPATRRKIGLSGNIWRRREISSNIELKNVRKIG